ncbi:hypothetical protein [Xanthomonas phage JGB6]|nr:hypothetical protein [Xanthomonas phage JGB6]
MILHAPMNGVISGLPDHGLTVEDFADTIWNDVFIGHYHNHKVFDDGKGRRIYSVGALTHQNWGDAESKAGYLLYYPDTGEVKHFETSAPKFVKVEIEDLDTIDVTGNFIKVIGGTTPEEAVELREDLLLAGALGAVVETVARKPAASRGGSSTVAPTIHTILQEYVERTYPGDDLVKLEALEILGEVYE